MIDTNKNIINTVGNTVGDVLDCLSDIPSNANIKFIDDGFMIELNPDSDNSHCCPHCESVERTEEPKSNKSHSLQNIPTDALLSFPLITQTEERDDIENKLLPQPLNCFFTKEVRNKNNMVADILGEIHRREVAAMLEYVTQMQSQQSIIMCDYVDDKNHKG